MKTALGTGALSARTGWRGDRARSELSGESTQQARRANVAAGTRLTGFDRRWLTLAERRTRTRKIPASPPTRTPPTAAVTMELDLRFAALGCDDTAQPFRPAHVPFRWGGSSSFGPGGPSACRLLSFVTSL